MQTVLIYFKIVPNGIIIKKEKIRIVFNLSIGSKIKEVDLKVSQVVSNNIEEQNYY